MLVTADQLVGRTLALMDILVGVDAQFHAVYDRRPLPTELAQTA